MFRLCSWLKRIILRIDDKLCNEQHPYYKHRKCQRPKGHDGQHMSRKAHGLTHFLYFYWYDNDKHSNPILKKRSP